MRRFYASPEKFDRQDVTLDKDETRHLRDVLRLDSGDPVSVFNGIGREFECVVTEIGKTESRLKIVNEIPPMSPESPVTIRIAPTVLNGDRYDLIIQKAVELGVVELIPLHTIRCEVRLKDAEKRLNRWRRIAMEATKQTGRATVMRIAEPLDIKELLTGEQRENILMFSERDGEPFDTVKESNNLTAAFGPKGGWDDAELASARENGVRILTLGGRILRAETAAIALTAVIQHRFGDLC